MGDRTGRRSANTSRSPGDARALAAIAAAVALGGLLRIAMARGDLWLDEVWSLELVRPLGSAAEVFYGISHDNNHFLNSLWLFWLGPDRSSWAYRLPAVLFGTLSIAVAAAIPWPRSRAAAVASAVLMAAAFPFVNYGSEARGYGGLIASILLAILLFERTIDVPTTAWTARRDRWLLGAAVGLGTLFHLTMLMTLAALVCAALLHFRADRSLSRALDSTLTLFRPALFGLLPAMIAVAAGILHTGAFRLGGDTPALPGSLLSGFGDQMRFVLGLPPGVPLSLCCVCSSAVLFVALRLADLPQARRRLIVSAVVLLPAAMLLLHLPNLEMARYYLLSGIVLLLTVADLVGTLWTRGRPGPRLCAAALFGSILMGQAVADRAAIDLGRGRYGDLLAGMADASGRVTYATVDGFRLDAVAERAAQQRHLSLDRVPASALCLRQPPWLIDIAASPDAPVTPTLDIRPPACRISYSIDRTVRTNPLSGMRWDVYARAHH